MKYLSFNRSAAVVTVITVIAIFSAFRMDAGAGSKRLYRMITATDKTTIIYNADRSIAKLTSTHNTSDGVYTAARIPVYSNGRLARTLFTDDEAANAPMLFSSFDYAENGRIERIKYYMDEEVHAYDSLVYDNAGRIIARYFFNKPQGKAVFENHNCQLFTWNNKGNVVSMENLGRLANSAAFSASSTVTYTYDDRPNAQQSVPALVYITDISPANMSANNILSETIMPAASNHQLVNYYEYTYNMQQYPVHVKARYAGNSEVMATELEWTE